MTTSPSWDDFRLVKAVADARSLVGAADALGLNHSTVFRRLGQLEDQLGTRLFERGRHAYVPTAAGDEMADVASRMARDIVDFERRVAGRDVKPSGDLRVTTNDTFLMHLLIPIFASFLRLYPDIRLNVLISNEALNLSKRDADVAIRATAEPPETLVGRKIATFAFARYVGKAAAQAPGYNEAEQSWVGYGPTMAAIPAARWVETHVPSHRIVFRCNTVLGLTESVAAGIGLGVLPCFIADQRDDLVRLEEPRLELGHTLWVLTHADLRHAARVRAFMEFAGVELAKRKRMIEGASA